MSRTPRTRNALNSAPATVAEVMDPAREFEPAVLAAVKKLRRAHAWTGTRAERMAKFTACLADLAAAYEMPNPPKLKFIPIARGCEFKPDTNTIILYGRFSVVSLLHGFAEARGQRTRERYAWSLNLFAQVFPKSFARARQVGPLLIATRS